MLTLEDVELLRSKGMFDLAARVASVVNMLSLLKQPEKADFKRLWSVSLTYKHRGLGLGNRELGPIENDSYEGAEADAKTTAEKWLSEAFPEAEKDIEHWKCKVRPWKEN